MAEPLPQFVRRRQVGWERLAALVSALEKGPLPLSELTELDRLYRRASSDLARARAFYPGSDALAYLNQLCARAYGIVYEQDRQPLKNLRHMLAQRFPRAFWVNRSMFLLSLAIFGVGALLGLFAGMAEPSSVSALFPQELRESVASGELWTDHALAASTPSVLGGSIAVNNLSVALSMFALGLTFGVGTAAVLFLNGLHLGAVLALTFNASLGVRLLGFVVAHGFVEIASILIAGQAGLLLGRALIAPGDLRRAQALQLAGRQALPLILGVLPLIAAIALVEGFVSPGQLFPGLVKLALGVSLVGLLFAWLARAGRAAHGN